MRLRDSVNAAGVFLMLMLLNATLGAPFSESDEDLDSLGPALEAVSRARREAHKSSRNSASARGLIRYRYPVHLKRSQSDDAENPEDDESFLDETNEDEEISEMAKDLALRMLLESAEKEAEEDDDEDKRKRSIVASRRNPTDIGHRKKVRPRFNDNEDPVEKKKRLASLMKQIDEDQDQDFDNIDGDAESEDDDQEELINAALEALAEEGIGENELESIFNQLQAESRDAEDSDDKEDNPHGIRSAYFNEKPSQGHNKGRTPLRGDDDDEDNDEGNPHSRGGSGKREQFPWMSGSLQSIKKRSSGNKAAALRKKRGSSAADSRDVSEQQEQPKVAMEIKDNESNRSQQNHSTKNNTQEVSGVTKTAAATAKTNNIRKKSVDWDDYFGYDKRKRSDQNLNQDMKDWLEAEYYKMIAGSLASKRKRGGEHSGHQSMAVKRKRNSVGRHLDWDEFPGDKRKRANVTLWDKRRRSISSGDKQILPRMGYAAWDRQSPSADWDDSAIQEAVKIIELLGNRAAPDDLKEFIMEAIRQKNPQVLAYLESLIEDEQDEQADENDEEDEEDSNSMKKKSLEDDKRRKRYPFDVAKRKPLRSVKPHARQQIDNEEGDDCPVMTRIMTTCNAAVHLMGGYRQLLNEACARYEACSACTDEEGACDADYHQNIVYLCGQDLLCRSQSEKLVSALREIHQVVDSLDGGQDQSPEEQCGADPCLLRFWKRR